MPDIPIRKHHLVRVQESSGRRFFTQETSSSASRKKKLYVFIEQLPEHLIEYQDLILSNLEPNILTTGRYAIIADIEQSKSLDLVIQDINQRGIYYDEYILQGNASGADYLLHGIIGGSENRCEINFSYHSLARKIKLNKRFVRTLEPCGVSDVNSVMALVAYAIVDVDVRGRIALPASLLRDDLSLDVFLDRLTPAYLDEFSRLDQDIISKAAADGVDTYLSRQEAALVSIPELSSDERYNFISAYLSWRQVTNELGMEWYLGESLSYNGLCRQADLLVKTASEKGDFATVIDSVSTCRDYLPSSLDIPDQLVIAISNRLKSMADPKKVVRYIQTLKKIGFGKVDEEVVNVLIEKAGRYNNISIRKAAMDALSALYNPKFESIIVKFLRDIFDSERDADIEVWADTLLFFEDRHGGKLQSLIMPNILNALSKKLRSEPKRALKPGTSDPLLVAIRFSEKLGELALNSEVINALQDIFLLQGYEYSAYRDSAKRAIRTILQGHEG